MAWKKFPYPDTAYVYSIVALKKHWKKLHAGDAEGLPKDTEILDAWIAFHAGAFEQAARLGLAAGISGYAVANKATCIHANYLEKSLAKKLALFQAVVERCEEQQVQQPKNAAGFYWNAYALGRYSQGISVVKALGEGIGTRIRASLESTLQLSPHHADAHIAVGVFQAEVIDKVGAIVGALAYGASKKQSIASFEAALALNPGSAIARVEYANALAMLDGRHSGNQASALYAEAAGMQPHDAMERLDIELAKQKCEG